MDCPQCSEGMEYIHGDIQSCCLYYCAPCNVVYRYCAEYDNLEQMCPCPPKPKTRLSALKP